MQFVPTCSSLLTGANKFEWTVLHLHSGSLLAYQAANLPVGTEIQTLYPFWIAYFAIYLMHYNNFPWSDQIYKTRKKYVNVIVVETWRYVFDGYTYIDR